MAGARVGSGKISGLARTALRLSFHLGAGIAGALGDPVFVEPRLKLHLLADDLARLNNGEKLTSVLPRPGTTFAFASAAEALGSMYVLEGSMLGGKLVARHVAASFGHTPAYHDAYGSRTGAMWREFQVRLRSELSGSQADAVIAAARTTFSRLQQWITRT